MLSLSSMCRFPARIVLALAVATAGLGLGGCVNQEKYDGLYEANRALQAQVSQLTEQLRAKENEIAALASRVAMGDNTAGMAGKTAEQLKAELAALQSQYAALLDRVNGFNVGGPLDAATDAALADLAAKHPDILEYDAARGMLRFKSDVTFASGSYELTPQAKQTIRDLGRILQEVPSASQYDIRVVGHTDAQPVSPKPNRPFRNNLELSAFRAISVRNDLVSAGLNAQKVEFAGWGEFRPAVANNANGNTLQNRRVELFLVRSTMGGNMLAAPAPMAPRATAPKGTTKPAANPDVMK